jgi:hypothetical protein
MCWHLLFSVPEFWDAVGGKRSLCMLRGVCRAFRADIPEREALLRVFRGCVMRKTNLFRILPLAVSDVLRLRSPVNFLEAFAIAERKAGGFDNCMALVRDKGWQCFRRGAALRAQVGGVHVEPAAFHAALRQGVHSARVWRYDSTLEELVPWQEFNPFCQLGGGPRAWVYSGILFAHQERRRLLRVFKEACGGWYRGIFKDVRLATRALKQARAARRARVVHWSISNNTLLVGVIAMRQWQPIPRTALAVGTP